MCNVIELHEINEDLSFDSRYQVLEAMNVLAQLIEEQGSLPVAEVEYLEDVEVA